MGIFEISPFGIFSVFVIAWFIYWQVQELLRSPNAIIIMEKKMRELKAMPFDDIVKKVGQGYSKEEIHRDGVIYYLGYVVARVDSIRGIHKETSKEVVAAPQQNEIINEVEILGYVDCMNFLPFGYCKMGPSFTMVLNRNGTVKWRR